MAIVEHSGFSHQATNVPGAETDRTRVESFNGDTSRPGRQPDITAVQLSTTKSQEQPPPVFAPSSTPSVQSTVHMSPVHSDEITKAANQDTLRQRLFGRRTPTTDTVPNPGRRAMLRAGVAGAGSILLAKTGLDAARMVMEHDAELTEQGIIRRPGRVTLVNKDSFGQNPHNTTLFNRGFNVNEVDTAGNVLAPYIKPWGQVAANDYGNENFDPAESVERAIDYCQRRGITTVNLWGRSMGGMVSMKMAPALVEAGIQIESVTVESSPSSRRDVIGAEDGDVTAINLFNTMAEMGLVSFGGEQTRRVAERRAQEVMRSRDPRILYTPIADTKNTNELPNNIVLQQIGFIGDFGITPDMADALEGVPIFYIGAKNGEADHTVDVVTAFEGYQSGLHKSPVTLYEPDGMTHANADQIPQIIGPLAHKMREDAHIGIWPAI